MIKLMQDGKEHYFDKNGIEIVKGTDATNPCVGRERESGSLRVRRLSA